MMARQAFDPSRVPFRHGDDGKLDTATEALIRNVIGAAIEVHRALGPGYLESVYENALAIELNHQAISYERQKPFEVVYRNKTVGGGQLDFLVQHTLIVELKAVESLTDLFTAQTLSYMKATGRKVALLINFNVPLLKQGIRRFIL